MIEKPPASEYSPFYQGYIARLPEGDILDLMREQRQVLHSLPATVSADRESFAYAPGKWTLREVIGHLCDGERIFGYRALRISRADRTPLPGFEENDYIENSNYSSTALADLVDELCLLRDANLHLFSRLDPAAWQHIGVANDHPVSVRALAFIIVGHTSHHLEILRDRYQVRC